jgi:hypothetical protein
MAFRGHRRRERRRSRNLGGWGWLAASEAQKPAGCCTSKAPATSKRHGQPAP